MKSEKPRYEAVIIGAGIGGLVCANYLAKSGMKVLIVERQQTPGGYCLSFKRENFDFDICRHLGGFAPGGVMHLIFLDLGLFQRLDIRRSDPADIIIIGDKRIDIFNDLSRTKESFKEAFPASAKNIDSFFGFLSGLDVFDIVKRYPGRNFQSILDEFFTDEETKNAFGPLLGNAGLGPSKLSAVKGLLLYSQFILDGGYYLTGGIGRFSELLLEGLKEKGGQALLNTAVESIKLKDTKAAGVVLEDGEFIPADYIIAACDATETFLELVGSSNLKKDFVKRLKTLLPSMSVFMVFLGLKGYSQDILKNKSSLWYNPIQYSAEANFDKTYRQIYEGKVDMQNSHVVLTPSFSNQETLKDKEGMALTLYVGVPYLNEQYWKEKKEEFCENIIKRAERLLPGLSGKVTVKDCATPQTFYKYTLNREGAMYGWASTPEQIDPSVMPPLTPIERLFLCGHWTTTGFGQGGIMSVAYTGMRVAEYILGHFRAEENINVSF